MNFSLRVHFESNFFLLFFTSLVLLIQGCENNNPRNLARADSIYNYEVVDSDGPHAPWGKTVGDINGDGLIDLVVGGHRPRRLTIIEKIKKKMGLFQWDYTGGELAWYQNPSWQRHLISEDFAIRTDLEIADIDSDGKNDIVILADKGIYWLKNPSWEKHRISSDKLHDIELGDLDADGDIDIVARSQSLFGTPDGNRVKIYRQDKNNQWVGASIKVPHGEGLKLADMDKDSLLDIIVNQQWLKNPGEISSIDSWRAIHYAVDWVWQDVFIDTADINLDGRQDIVLAPAEEVGEFYQISWFEAPVHTAENWKKHIIDPEVEAVHHFIAARDIDLDGDIDVLTAEMNQGQNSEVKYYLNNGNSEWSKHVIGTEGSHSMRALDIDQDGDIDLFGAQWQKEGYDAKYTIQLWRNTLSDNPAWTRHLIDDNKPGQATFVYASDINGDGAKDIITGGFWYQQPGSLNGEWRRFSLGDKATNIALVADFDGDSDNDILASGWRGYDHKPSLIQRILNRLEIKKYEYKTIGNRFVWARNDGHGNFEILENIEHASGDFLQGIALLNDSADQLKRILLSWHHTGEGLQALTLPDDPVNQIWQWSVLHPESQDEQINVGDIDNDGFNDILLGTKWLRHRGPDDWELKNISNSPGEPDRNQLVDLNNDGLLDVVIGYQAISEKGKLAWYQQPDDGEGLWQEHLIAEIIGPMSLSVTDMDGDEDMDIVAGEHNLLTPQDSKLLWFENLDGSAKQWKAHLIHQGDEHHDGALTVDLDNDGDLDVVSIGWSHGKVLIYENKRK